MVESLLSRDQMVEFAQRGLKTALTAGTYGALDLILERLQELGVEVTPLETLDMRIQARERYSLRVSKDEMLMNPDFAPELDHLKKQREDLQNSGNSKTE